MASASAPAGLARRLGLFDAVVAGLGAMLGAGIFAPSPRLRSPAGPRGLLPGLGVAALVAYCNATSSARLAARYPLSGGTYVYGRERLGPFWGYLAGWSFVVGKTASCAAMALTLGAYAWPQHPSRATRCVSARRSRRSDRCSPSFSASHAPRRPWRATGTSRPA